MKAETVNGWANRATWLVSLNLKEEGMYRAMVAFMESYEGSDPYRDFIRENGLDSAETVEGVSFSDPALNLEELNEILRELI